MDTLKIQSPIMKPYQGPITRFPFALFVPLAIVSATVFAEKSLAYHQATRYT